jgi:hypothetical protein
MPRAVETLAAATGSEGGLGKIGTIAHGDTLYVVCPVNDQTGRVKWVVATDKAFTVQRYIAETNPLGGTLTLADATAVDDGDTFVLNGETYTAESTEGDAAASSRKFWTGANNAAAAANLAALLNNAAYGLPGFAAAVAAVDATDVVTLTALTAATLQFAQGTSAADEIVFAETTANGLMLDGAAVADATATGTAGVPSLVVEHENDGFVSVIGLTNNDGADAMTATVKAIRFAE